MADHTAAGCRAAPVAGAAQVPGAGDARGAGGWGGVDGETRCGEHHRVRRHGRAAPARPRRRHRRARGERAAAARAVAVPRLPVALGGPARLADRRQPPGGGAGRAGAGPDAQRGRPGHRAHGPGRPPPVLDPARRRGRRPLPGAHGAAGHQRAAGRADRRALRPGAGRAPGALAPLRLRRAVRDGARVLPHRREHDHPRGPAAGGGPPRQRPLQRRLQPGAGAHAAARRRGRRGRRERPGVRPQRGLLRRRGAGRRADAPAPARARRPAAQRRRGPDRGGPPRRRRTR